jgi:DNA-binding beta-propeller fold protein YncE
MPGAWLRPAKPPGYTETVFRAEPDFMRHLLRFLLPIGALCIVFPALAQPLVYVTDPGSNRITAVDSGHNTIVRKLGHVEASRGLAISPDGTRIYVAADGTAGHGVVAVFDGTKIADTNSNPFIATLAVGGKPIATAYDALTGLLYVADADNNEVDSYQLDDIDTDNPVAELAFEALGSVDAMALSPDGRTLAIASQSNRSLTLYNLRKVDANVEGASVISLDSEPRALAFSASGDTLWIATKAGLARYSLTEGTLGKTKLPHGTTSVAVATRTHKVYFGADTGKTVYAYDAREDTTSSIAVNGTVSGLSLSADGTRLYVVQECSDCGMAVVSTPDAQLVSQVNFGQASATTGQFAGPGDIHAPNAATRGSVGEQLSGSVRADDYDNRNLSYVLLDQPARGTLDFSADGAYAYTPPSNGFSGVAHFVWEAKADGGGEGSPIKALSRPIVETLEIAPEVSTINDQKADPGATIESLGFTLTGTKPFQIVLKSSNSDLVDADKIGISAGCGTSSLSCSLEVPVKNVDNGHTTITLIALGADGLSAESSFKVTVGNGDNDSGSGSGALAPSMLGGLILLMLVFALRRRQLERARRPIR